MIKKLLKVLLITSLLFPAAQTVAAPKAKLWEKWRAHDAKSAAAISHDEWDSFLQQYVADKDGLNVLDYAAVGDADKTVLKNYLQKLTATVISDFNQNQQRAYWINLYNALTVDTILSHFPVDSIRDIDISPGVFSDGPWGKKLLEVEGEPLSLDDIEHRILRPIWQDNRIHYAVNCASIGCPNLAATAYTADNADELLDAGARQYINHPRGATVKNGALRVSSIYLWFIEDFGGDDKGVIMHLKQYADEKLNAALQTVDNIGDDDYNWQLNRP